MRVWLVIFCTALFACNVIGQDTTNIVLPLRNANILALERLVSITELDNNSQKAVENCKFFTGPVYVLEHLVLGHKRTTDDRFVHKKITPRCYGIIATSTCRFGICDDTKPIIRGGQSNQVVCYIDGRPIRKSEISKYEYGKVDEFYSGLSAKYENKSSLK